MNWGQLQPECFAICQLATFSDLGVIRREDIGVHPVQQMKPGLIWIFKKRSVGAGEEYSCGDVVFRGSSFIALSFNLMLLLLLLLRAWAPSERASGLQRKWPGSAVLPL
ncbi:hypothetical protein JOB18_027217 [Solea senegalensis]|uniref:Uncharacterized protein n=1 Tax=Solea senegalensis TaxID=28829 RepID=A0AAV6SRU8_SOLSE|nr:hypothetical protein JOB18_027217 [Solea senegalensis]